MKGTVLFVDDEPAILRAIERTLAEDEGLTVLTATGGPEALELLATRPIDVVVSDQTMPGMNGAELLAKVRERHPDVVRMTLTGLSDSKTVMAAVNQGEVRRFLTKPWDADELRNCLHDAVGERRLEREIALLRQEAVLSPEQIERARRIAARLEKPKPIGEVLVELGQLARAEYERISKLHRSRLDLVSILREDGFVTEEGFAVYQEARRKTPGRPDRSLLVDAGLVTEEQYLHAVSAKHDIPLLDPEVGLVDTALLLKTSIPFLRKNGALPLRIVDGILTVVVSDPLNRQILTDLAGIYGVKVNACAAPSARIAEALATLERNRDEGSAGGGTSLQYREIQETPAADESGEGAVQIVDYLLLRSIELGASDLHIEPMNGKVRVRIRVDGVMRNLTDLPAEFAGKVLSRLKILAGADIAERRLHQDGRIFVKVEGREVDIRASIYATMFGETIVLRLLDRRRGLHPLEQLGFEPGVLSILREVVLRSSTGLVLITGPTGSGKTTTLYSFVDYVNDPSIKVITCEDPVEYVLDGIAQCSVNEKTGPTFADSLRAMVRQDPDVIVVGEIRDPLTSRLAVESALTGHKVFTSLHTEDSVGAVARLLDLGIEPFLVASTINTIVAQRLVRRVCPDCRRPAEASREDLRFLGLERSDFDGFGLVEGAGCPKCGGIGFKGRAGIHEVLLPDDDFRDAILNRSPSKVLRALARKLPGFLTLQEDGILKAVSGATTLSEVVTGAPRDQNARPPSALRETDWLGRKP
jgi:type IV pilus assembly protein PilB